MSNPVLRERVFSEESHYGSLGLDKPMSINGTLFKTLTLGAFLMLTAAYSWYLVFGGFADKANMLMTAGAIGGFIMVMIICFAPKNNSLAITTPIYAMFEGLFLGGLSAMFNAAFPGIVTQAVLGTFLAILGMFLLYSSRTLRATNTFKKVILISTFSVAGIYLLELILMLFHVNIPYIFSNSPIGIGFSACVCVIAALNLVLDFDFIEQFSNRAPKYMEWYSGFSLMVTIVWMYVEILNLLAKISSNNN